MISINISELIWTVINFFLLLFLLNRFLYKPVISFMEQRQARIDAKLREEEEAKARIEENDARILEEKNRSREEAKKILAQNAEEIEKHNAEVLQEAKKASVQNRKDLEAALSQRQEKTAQQLHEAAPELAAMLAEKLLSEE
jgi:F-type H+-transporting ATPase subunit b